MSTEATDAAPSLSEKIRTVPGATRSRGELLDRIFFVLGTLAALWLAWALLAASLHSWWGIGLAVVFWLALAYLALPRLNRVLAAIYVPDYFIGRTRTSDGLLGDPINIAFLGTGEQLATVMRRAGWTLADPVNLKSSIGIVSATVARRSYDAAPVSPLVLFGRSQDAAYQQEVDGSPGKRHHLRLWQTPSGWLLPGGHRVDWLCDAAYDRRVGLSLFTLQVTHKIDANIDVERDHVVKSVTTAEPRVTVNPLRDFTTGYHARNGGGDTVHTDGTLPVVDVSGVTPDADTPSLAPVLGDRIPYGVLFAALAALATAVVSVVDLVRNLDTSTSRPITLTGVALAVLVAVLALLTLRRSDVARRLMLLLSVVQVVDRVSVYSMAATESAKVLAIVPAAMSVLVLVALSSSPARQWATGRLDSEDGD